MIALPKVYRWGFYALGMVVLALGITLNTKTGLGVSPIISVAYSVSEIWGLNFGDMTFLLYGLFVLAQLALRRREEWISTLLQLVVSLIFSRFLNLFSACITYDCTKSPIALNFVLLLLAVVLTGVGVGLTIDMRLAPNPGDGIVQAICQKAGWEQGFGKNVFDLGCVLVTCVIGLVFGGQLIGISIGTLVAMVGVGRAVSLFNHLFQEKICRLAEVVA